jgi:hypothetical protein
MSSARVLTFDPSEFVVLEDSLEVDETIQRPEAVRFFTIEEQETDAFELLLPKGRTTQFQRDEVRDVIERMRDLYDSYVLALPDAYALREPERGTNLSWVHPVYADVQLQAYDVASKWSPLFAEEAKQAPGFYSRMIAALPRPYLTTGGAQHAVSEPTEFVNAGGEKRLRVLPVFTTTQSIEHEDRTIEIAPRPMPGSEDVVNRLGYYLDKRPLEIPNPLADHPFLKANEPTFVDSTASLNDVLPSLDAVLTHGVPVTTDPYGIGGAYLKLYDINLSSIPWSSWTSRFPPVEVEQTLRDKSEIPFPKVEGDAPSDTILKAYKAPYAPGLSVREWLMRRDDGGEFVVRALQSLSSAAGSVESIPGIDLPMPAPPPTTLEACGLLGLSFPDFLVKGVLRRVPQLEKGQDTFKGPLVCAPLEFIRQERARVGYLNRKPWGDETKDAIPRGHLMALRNSRRQEPEIPILAEQKTPGKPESAHRRDVVAVLNDPRRHPRDKLQDLKDVVKDDLLDGNLYRDADQQFVLCAHTLALLAGDLERDRLYFYDVWTATAEGWRVCKFCGERLVGEDLVDQAERDEQGLVLNQKEALETPQIYVGESLMAFGKGLKELSAQFNIEEDPSDAIVFEFISLFQLLPDAETVRFFLDQGKAVKAKKSDSNTTAGLEFRGIAGIAIAALLFQCHIPLLEPRRSFWSKPTTFAGYPRDAQWTSGDFGILDILLMVLENTYRGFPRAVTGPHKHAVRAVLTDPTKVRSIVLVQLEMRLLQNPEIQKALQSARALVAQLPVPPPIVPFLPIRPPTLTTRGYPVCPGGQAIFTGKALPESRQPTLSLRRGIQAGVRQPVRVPVSERVEVRPTPADQVRRRVALKGDPRLVKDGPRTNLLLATRLASLQRKALPIAEIDPTQSPAMLKSIAKGFLQEASQGYVGDPSKDVTLFCLLADYNKSKAEARKIRATERITYTQRMADFTDLEREVNMELAKLGMAPTIIDLAERTQMGRIDLSHLVDVGVGLPQDTVEGGDIAASNAGAGVDNGNYGDYEAVPFREGRDPYEATVLDDAETSI